MPELALIVIGLAVLAVAVVAWRSHAQTRDALIRLEARLEEQLRQNEARAQSAIASARALENALRDDLARIQSVLDKELHDSREQLKVALGEHETRFERRHGDALRSLHETLDNGLRSARMQLLDALSRSSEQIGKHVDALTQRTDKRLEEISGQVERRLAEGFEKTTATFSDVLKRLALIDEAQKKITELSSNVVSLQEVLSDKRSRGAFGEVQLNALVRNMMPETSFALQHTLSNERVADCVLFLPPPTGNVAIDAKFPKEAYDRMTDISASEPERREAERQFKLDVRKHIRDVAERYIIPGETSDGAVMFIPAEAIFAEIHAHHPELVEEAYRTRVWLVSPTTLMAILNTARAVLKDEATRRQVHIIQEHLGLLAKDFQRFRARMDALSRHVRQASEDMERVHISAGKITDRFHRIERVELDTPDEALLEHRESEDEER